MGNVFSKVVDNVGRGTQTLAQDATGVFDAYVAGGPIEGPIAAAATGINDVTQHPQDLLFSHIPATAIAAWDMTAVNIAKQGAKGLWDAASDLF